MGKLIFVVGSTGVGKTALVRALSKKGPFVVGLEEHSQRPFQRFFKTDARYALANQLDYLLLRAEQEHILRQSSQTGLMDGGLEMDFYGFTRLFHARLHLTDSEFDLCKRLYEFIRIHQPPPDLVILLTARPEIVAQRLAIRKRINIAAVEDIPLLDSYLGEWLNTLNPDQLLRLDVSESDFGYHRLLPTLLNTLNRITREILQP
jgi:deoxyadenosine/deoxycytidine kinase